jgi:hypothetical protein
VKIKVGKNDGTLYLTDGVANERVTYGANWEIPMPEDVTIAQRHVMNAQMGEGDRAQSMLRNTVSGWVAFVVRRKDGSVDFYTVAPDAKQLTYTCTVTVQMEKRIPPPGEPIFQIISS